DDERGNPKQRHEHRVQRSGGNARGECRGGSERDRPSGFARRDAEHDRTQREQGPDREIDAAGQNDGRESDSEQTDLGARAHDLACVGDRQKIRSDNAEHHDLDAEAHGKNAFVRHWFAAEACRRRTSRAATASAATAARTIAPSSARSQYASVPRNTSAGPAVASSRTPMSEPTREPRPP